MVVAWSRKSCLGPAEIVSFVCVILFKDEGRRVSPRFHIFFLMLIKRMKKQGEFNISLRDPRRGKIPLKIDCVLWRWSAGCAYFLGIVVGRLKCEI